MIYRGFNQNELKKITDILERNGVHFDVSVPTESMDYINDKSKRVDHRFMDNLLQIEIEKDEFEKIAKPDLSKLFDLRIYPEEDSPFTDEEVEGMSANPDEPAARKPDKHANLNQAAAILAVALMGALYLWKSGIFK
jgi:hypothetical protein